MPKHASPKSLKKIAFEDILKHINDIWSSKYLEDWKDKPSFKTEDASAEQKDANAKKLLEELT